MYELLNSVNSPTDLKKLTIPELQQLASEMRSFIIETVSKTGGHLSSSLGCVELAIAIHYVFDTPEDRVIWDVGHQAYAHKILTGRRDSMGTLRQYKGIAGFPKRDESPYDAFGTGHSSTSISAALGMGVANKLLNKRNRHHVAVIGDGAMTGGMAFEALNSAGDMKDINLLLILNDNDYSISRPVGALSKHFTKLMSGQFYAQARDIGKAIVKPIPILYDLTKKVEEYSKGMVSPHSTLFEEFGLNYHGPIDGNDLSALIPVLKNMRDLPGPLVLHVVTKKGLGYEPALSEPTKYHGASPFDVKVGIKEKPHAPTYTEVFGKWICEMASKDPRLVGITPAMKSGSGLDEFAERFPNRFFDVAIAEQHAVTFAAGLAADGMKPVCAIYSTFSQRAFDQIVHDTALQNLPVLFAIDRGGIVGADGATHHGAFDLSFLRCIPILTLMAPADENECKQMLYTGYMMDSPAVVRYPRGKGPGVPIQPDMYQIPIGKALVMRTSEAKKGRRVAILAFGSMVAPMKDIANKLDASLVNMRFVKPVDAETIRWAAENHDLIVTIEENVLTGGAGSGVLENLASQGLSVPVLQLGIPDQFVSHGDNPSLLKELKLDPDSVLQRIQERLEK
ncbi:MAG: 1-deoxy-D-xylulose-5-phosphate synthase [Burkholderiales bacterium]|nr:1-deoxy-D-xylulose-5-phosphate synthase [Burkholderiales bacterium]